MKRPTSVTVFGVLNVVLGTLRLFGSLFAAAVLALAKATVVHASPFIEALHRHAVYRLFVTVGIPLQFVAAAVLVVAGVGLLLMKRWARVTTIVYAIYAIFQALISIAVSVSVVIPAAVEASSGRGPEAMLAMITSVAGLAGRVLGLAYPILLLIFMTRPKVVEAFRAGESTPLSSA